MNDSANSYDLIAVFMLDIVYLALCYFKKNIPLSIKFFGILVLYLVTANFILDYKHFWASKTTRYSSDVLTFILFAILIIKMFKYF